ncbi:hypothetical protein ACVWZA_000622 [Sphingomonas sp. UYAg733]
MKPEFTVDAIQPDLWRMRLSGFFDAAAAERLRMHSDAVLEELTCAPNEHVTLADLTGMLIQPQDLIPTFSSLFSRPTQRSRRMAIILGTALQRIQVKRLIGDRTDIAFFADETTAMTWLRSD